MRTDEQEQEEQVQTFRWYSMFTEATWKEHLFTSGPVLLILPLVLGLAAAEIYTGMKMSWSITFALLVSGFLAGQALHTYIALSYRRMLHKSWERLDRWVDNTRDRDLDN